MLAIMKRCTHALWLLPLLWGARNAHGESPAGASCRMENPPAELQPKSDAGCRYARRQFKLAAEVKRGAISTLKKEARKVKGAKAASIAKRIAQLQKIVDTFERASNAKLSCPTAVAFRVGAVCCDLNRAACSVGNETRVSEVCLERRACPAEGGTEVTLDYSFAHESAHYLLSKAGVRDEAQHNVMGYTTCAVQATFLRDDFALQEVADDACPALTRRAETPP